MIQLLRFRQIQRYNWNRTVFKTRRYVASTNEEERQKPKHFDAIPQPSTISNLVQLVRMGGMEKIQKIQNEKFEKFGPISKEQVGKQFNVNIIRPEDSATVFRKELGKFPTRNLVDLSILMESPIYSFLGNDETRWRMARKAVGNPLLLPGNVKRISTKLDSVALDLALKLEREQKNGFLPDLSNDITGYTTESICNLVYGKRMGYFATPQNQKMKEFIEATSSFTSLTFEVSTGFKLRQMLIARKYKKTLNRLHLLSQLFLQSSSVDRNDENLYDRMIERGMSYEFIQDTAIALCQAGVETTSTGLLWCLYDLANNQDIQEKAYQEIVSVIGSMSDDVYNVDLDYFEKLPYLKSCIYESLRLHPIVPVLSRTIQEDVVLSGYHVPANTVVVMWNPLVSYSGQTFHQAKKMNPERWIRNSSDNDVQPFSFLPFGFGIRACLGRRFAMRKMIVALARILQRFQLKYNGKEEVEQAFKVGVGFPAKEIPIEIKKRSILKDKKLLTK